MHFIFGGRGMGKLDYALRLMPGASVCDLEADGPSGIARAGIVRNVHLLVRSLAARGEDPAGFFRNQLEALRGKIVIGDEVGCGVVPVEPFERQWRDEAGRVYQLLAAGASDVTRLWAGIPQVLKRNGAPV